MREHETNYSFENVAVGGLPVCLGSDFSDYVGVVAMAVIRCVWTISVDLEELHALMLLHKKELVNSTTTSIFLPVG